MDNIDKNVVRTTIDRKGDMRPVIFLFTYGTPTDNVTLALEKWCCNYLYKNELISVAGKDVAKLIEPISNLVYPKQIWQ